MYPHLQGLIANSGSVGGDSGVHYSSWRDGVSLTDQLTCGRAHSEASHGRETCSALTKQARFRAPYGWHEWAYGESEGWRELTIVF